MATVRLLLVGDVMGKPGVLAVRRLLPKLIADKAVDLTIVNGENVAGGVGITPELAKELFEAGADVITTGNHVWRQREIRPYIEKEPRLLRPQNFRAGQPGRGFGVFETAAGVPIAVMNLVGQVFMDPADSPFGAADEALAGRGKAAVAIVDFHAEVTSEKRAMGFHLEGRVSAVIGTHTHVQTADEQILKGGTAFITDVGMTGPHDSVIGMRKDLVLSRFVTGMPEGFKPATGGVLLQAALVEADARTGRASRIERLSIPMPE
jgi:2',3'-cyclic-nucleotide 2'-phosphodiesterase